MKSPQNKTTRITKLTVILLLAFTYDAFADSQLDEATEQRIIREQNRVIQNQQIAIEADKRKTEADIIERQRSIPLVKMDSVVFPDSKKIQKGCDVINSSDLINGTIPSNPPFVAFFHDYLLVKSLHPEYLSRFDCAKKLEDQAIPLFALDHEPLEKPILQGDNASQTLHLHQEIIRNLYQIVIVSRDNNSGKAANVIGVKNGLLFVTEDEQFLKQILNPKIYLKFNLQLNDNIKEEYFLPLKNYQRIKSYLIKLDQLDKAKNKNDKNIPGFAISYTAFVNALSIDSKKDHQFAWVDEIRQTPYFSFYDLVTYLINADQDSQMLRWGVLLGYFYSYELLHSNFVLIKAANESGLAPKSILPIIEKSMKSGNKDFCAAVKNPEKPIASNRLSQKQRNLLNILTKDCPALSRIGDSGNLNIKGGSDE